MIGHNSNMKLTKNKSNIPILAFYDVLGDSIKALIEDVSQVIHEYNV